MTVAEDKTYYWDGCAS